MSQLNDIIVNDILILFGQEKLYHQKFFLIVMDNFFR